MEKLRERFEKTIWMHMNIIKCRTSFIGPQYSTSIILACIKDSQQSMWTFTWQGEYHQPSHSYNEIATCKSHTSIMSLAYNHYKRAPSSPPQRNTRKGKQLLSTMWLPQLLIRTAKPDRRGLIECKRLSSSWFLLSSNITKWVTDEHFYTARWCRKKSDKAPRRKKQAQTIGTKGKRAKKTKNGVYGESNPGPLSP